LARFRPSAGHFEAVSRVVAQKALCHLAPCGISSA
jgi:hypothetical protein